MEYIIVMEPDQKNSCIMQNSNDFISTFSSYESAKEEAEKWKESGCCKSYNIYGLCTDEKKHII